MLLTQGDIEFYPIPKNSHTCFSRCCWNVNSLVDNKMQKISLL